MNGYEEAKEIWSVSYVSLLELLKCDTDDIPTQVVVMKKAPSKLELLEILLICALHQGTPCTAKNEHWILWPENCVADLIRTGDVEKFRNRIAYHINPSAAVRSKRKAKIKKVRKAWDALHGDADEGADWDDSSLD